MEHQIASTAYDNRYNQSEFYWGSNPSLLCYEVLKLRPPLKRLRVLDLGCGEGKDSLFFARNGYEVTGVDLSEVGLQKAASRSRAAGVNVQFILSDINEFRLSQNYDVIFSSGALQYLKSDLRAELIENLKKHTTADGVHALHTFVKKPFVAKAPDAEDSETLWKSGELMSLYHDWLIDWTAEEIKPCNSSGVPHWHAHNRLVARNRGLTAEK